MLAHEAIAAEYYRFEPFLRKAAQNFVRQHQPAMLMDEKYVLAGWALQCRAASQRLDTSREILLVSCHASVPWRWLTRTRSSLPISSVYNPTVATRRFT